MQRSTEKASLTAREWTCGYDAPVLNSTRFLCQLFFVIAVCLVLPSVAQAQALSVVPAVTLDFEWFRGRGADSCPNAAQVTDEIEEKAGRKVFTPGAKHKIWVLIARTKAVWTALIEEHDATGSVTKNDPVSSETDDCKVIKDAAVFNVMLLLGYTEEPRPPPPPPPKYIATPPPNPDPSTANSTADPHTNGTGQETIEEPWKITFTARGSIRYGLLPGVSPDIGAFGSVGKNWWEFSAGLSWMPESRTEDGNHAFGLTTVWLGGCLHPLRRPRFTLSGCGHALVGGMHNVVLHKAEPTPAGAGQLLWVGVAASPRLRVFPTSRLVFELGGDITVPIPRYRLTDVNGNALMYEQLPVAVSGFFGVGMSIP